ncbi:MAG: hypothetical protein CL927_11285 [Deltaproteobacteria bacterium]|nr:hypothetical protein [Deltaproteobacteria bacterium]HCH63568.1 hypothetical protein [Deltaproteobacteria bacterium]
MSHTSAKFVAVPVLLAAAWTSSAALAGPGRFAKKVRNISVQNDRAETVEVHIDGSLAGILPGGARAAFPAEVGRHRVTLLDEEGSLVLAKRVLVERRERARVRLKAGSGTVHLINDSEVDQSVVVVDRRGQMYEETIDAGGELDLSVTPGEVSVRSAGIWFERGAPLFRDQISVAPGRTATVDLSTVESALLRVQNVGEERLEVYLDEDRVGRVAADAVALFPVPIGTHEFVVMADGLEVVERTVEVTERRGGQMVLDAERTRLSIVNDSPRGAMIQIDGVRYGWLASGATRTLELFAGPREVMLMGPEGRVYAEEVLRISGERDFRWAPRLDLEASRRAAKRRLRRVESAAG